MVVSKELWLVQENHSTVKVISCSLFRSYHRNIVARLRKADGDVLKIIALWTHWQHGDYFMTETLNSCKLSRVFSSATLSFLAVPLVNATFEASKSGTLLQKSKKFSMTLSICLNRKGRNQAKFTGKVVWLAEDSFYCVFTDWYQTQCCCFVWSSTCL